MLKVRLDAATFGSDVTVSQAGAAIPPNSDGSYTVEFMRLGMTVAKKAASAGATFYQYASFAGLSAKLSEGSYTAAQLLAAGIPDNSIGSMQVDAGLTVSLYDGDGFVTTLGDYGADVADLATIGAAGKVSSLKIAKGSTVPVKSRMQEEAVRVRWSEGALLVRGMTDGRMCLADLQGRRWDFRIAGGTAPAAFLPAGIYRAWIDGAQDASGIVTVLR